MSFVVGDVVWHPQIGSAYAANDQYAHPWFRITDLRPRAANGNNMSILCVKADEWFEWGWSSSEEDTGMGWKRVVGHDDPHGR